LSYGRRRESILIFLMIVKIFFVGIRICVPQNCC